MKTARNMIDHGAGHLAIGRNKNSPLIKPRQVYSSDPAEMEFDNRQLAKAQEKREQKQRKRAARAGR